MKKQRLKKEQVNWQEVYLRLDLPKPNWWIIHPEIPIRQSWDILMLLAVIYVAIMVPPQLAFNSLNLEEIDFLMYALFGLDILITFLTGFRDGSSGSPVIMNQRRIAMNYIFSWLVIDVIATFPFEYAVINAETGAGDSEAQLSQAAKSARVARTGRVLRIARVARLLRLTRIVKVFKFADMIKSVVHHLTIHPAIFRLFKAFAAQLYLSHLLACLWCFVPVLEDGNPDSWIYQRGFGVQDYETNFGSLYLTGLYWAFTTMTTVGYGDVAAVTTGEMIFATFAQILGVSFYGFILGSINAVVESLDKRNASYERKAGQYVLVVIGKLPSAYVSYFLVLCTMLV